MEEKIIKQFMANLKSSSVIKKSARLMGDSPESAINFLLKEYECKSLLELKKKLQLLPAKKKAKLEKIQKIHAKCRTLEKTSKKLNISRERVRQLLEEGAKYGLFKYERSYDSSEDKFNELKVLYNRESLVGEIKSLISRSKICSKLNIGEKVLNKLLQHFNVNIREYRRIAKAGKCFEGYSVIVDTLGHHPTTTEMNSRAEWRLLWFKILRLWGGIDNFRKELGVEKPKYRMHPNTLAAFKKNLAKNLLFKETKKRETLGLIKKTRVVKAKMIRQQLNVSAASMRKYLNELLKENLIIKIGRGNQTRYSGSQP